MASVEYGIQTETLDALRARLPIALGSLIMERWVETQKDPDSYAYPVSTEMMAQFLPDVRELDIVAGRAIDPTSERAFSPAKGLYRVYPSQALFLCTLACISHCRYCFREDVIGRSSMQDPSEALEYLRAHNEITELILSGGDPMTLPASRLMPLIESFLDVVDSIRVDTRAITVGPERFTDKLIDFFDAKCRDSRGMPRISFVNQINHPDEFNHPAVLEGIKKIKRLGINIYNQAVLLKGVNTDPATQRKLWQEGFNMGITPLYLYLPDSAPGTAHFDVSDDAVITAYQALDTLPYPVRPTLTYVDPFTNMKERSIASSPQKEADLRLFLNQRRARLSIRDQSLSSVLVTP